MTDKLAEICAVKRDHVLKARGLRPLAAVEAAAKAADAPRGFIAALQRASTDGYALIAEIKKASPSKGVIRADFDPATLARAYLAGGASCLSVLTDTPYFQGHDEYLVAARAAVDLPALRKDFMLEPYQIFEARALGADCILLILACLSDAQAAELEDVALALGMDVLVETHDADEMTRALKLKSPLIGVNNRNLKTLSIDLGISEQLRAMCPPDRMLVSESGLGTPADLGRMARIGIRTFLIGESLMRQADVTAATRAILSNPLAA